ncbi:hypothetical protein T02_16345 [Trichinella nativa]|uniref:Uncharacterized protein n=1 Tax=Trichinella nativa TaxID=6335 RepID=A0A0V1LFK7_9BILA|nr:hypothetical protein T02_16345 [Trichinella nativa]
MAITIEKSSIQMADCFGIRCWHLFVGNDKQIFFLLIFYRVERFDSCETLPNSASGIADACKQSQPPII